ncbi:MAG: hypothetical protein KF698_02760 [Anaerolineales bacterium]|nr:hypothetical protein [Anaerolineales bacterium]
MKPRTFYILLALIAVLGSLAVYFATSQFGPGLSTDGARYLSTAESLAAGRGAIDYLGEPLVNWPPLYPAIVAVLHWLTRADVMLIAQAINIVAFGVIIALSGVFVLRALPGRHSFALLAALVIASSRALVETAANVASDPLFMLCVLLWLLAAQQYAATRSPRSFWQMALLAAAGCFLRYAGSSLVMAGGLLVLWAWRSEWRQALVRACAYGALAAGPIGLWAVFHNYRLTGILLGTHQPSYPPGLFVAAIEKVASWLLPERILLIVPPLALFGGLLAALALRSTRQRWAAWLQRTLAAPVLPAAAFTLVYGAMLVFTISYSEHRVPGSQRLHAVLLPCLLVLGYTLYQEFGPRLAGAWRTLALAAAAVWLLFPIYRTVDYVRSSYAEGDVSYYNLYNTRALRRSDLAAHLSQFPFEPDDKVYSNNEGAAWFLLRRRIYRLPRYDGETQASLQAALTEFDGWPAPDDTAWLIWFGDALDYKRDVPTPQQMREHIPASTMRVLNNYRSGYGEIYVLDTE